jgi:hypothetical protein
MEGDNNCGRKEEKDSSRYPERLAPAVKLKNK